MPRLQTSTSGNSGIISSYGAMVIAVYRIRQLYQSD
jgi:hypothetical protein